MNKFKNTKNGHIEEISKVTWLWQFLFGTFYFMYKGIWKHAIIAFVLALCTMGISHFIYPFFAKGIVRNYYLHNGWKPVK